MDEQWGREMPANESGGTAWDGGDKHSPSVQQNQGVPLSMEINTFNCAPKLIQGSTVMGGETIFHARR